MYNPLMKFLFGSTFVCTDLESAEMVPCDPDISVKCVTMDGEVVEPATTYSEESSEDKLAAERERSWHDKFNLKLQSLASQTMVKRHHVQSPKLSQDLHECKLSVEASGNLDCKDTEDFEKSKNSVCSLCDAKNPK